MSASKFTVPYDPWPHSSYEIRVRPTSAPKPPMFIWGSAGISHNITFDKPLVLHIRNDIFGDVVTLGTAVAAGTQTIIGTLQPGECISIPLQGISGVFATCASESTVCCIIDK